MEKVIECIVRSGDILFLMLGAVMVFAVHAGFYDFAVSAARHSISGLGGGTFFAQLLGTIFAVVFPVVALICLYAALMPTLKVLPGQPRNCWTWPGDYASFSGSNLR